MKKMNPKDLIIEIMEKGKLDDDIDQLTDWIIKNEGKDSLAVYLSAIKDDGLLMLTPEGKAQGKVIFKRLHYSPFFNGLAIKYAKNGWFNESIKIFEAILSRTPKDVDSLLNYGSTLSNMLIRDHDQGKGINEKLFTISRDLTFQAYRYDKKVHPDRWLKPAYKNLCFLRAIEALMYHYKKEKFTSFTLAWVSIEMSIYAIWCDFVKSKTDSGTKEFMRWNVDHIIETLYLSDIESFKSVHDNLVTLRGIRNKLLHGELDNPSEGNVNLCLKTAFSLTKLIADRLP